ncbi:ABC transporter permease [Enterococcus sp. YC2-6]|uniref:ABC transporter permease n=1 Tax=Enterococcus sp. YC2-6 TaxID=2874514 RepID=UPI00201F03AF|nr:ABC transporter permease [Enterococcus sp. YC2-6]
MKNFFFQVSINFKRIIFRNLRFLVFSVLMPIGFYLLFTQVMTQGISKVVLQTWNIDYLISMIIYSTLISSIFTVSNTLLDDHLRKFDLFIALSPISKTQYYLSMLVVFLSLNFLSAISLVVVAVAINHIVINLTFLLILCLIAPLLSLPLFLLGIIVSLTGTGNVVNLLSNILVFPMAIFSGLWWPLTSMPTWMQKIGILLPTYHSAQLLKELVNRHYFHLGSFGVLLLWGIFLVALLKGISTLRDKNEVQTI